MQEQAPQPLKPGKHISPQERVNLDALIRRLQASELGGIDEDSENQQKISTAWEPNLDWAPNPSAQQIQEHLHEYGTLETLPHLAGRNYTPLVTEPVSKNQLDAVQNETPERYSVELKSPRRTTQEEHLLAAEGLLDLIRIQEESEESNYSEVTTLVENSLAHFMAYAAENKGIDDAGTQAIIAGLQAKLASRADLAPYDEPQAHEIIDIVNEGGLIKEVVTVRGLNRADDLFASSERGFRNAIELAGGINNAPPELLSAILSKRADMYALTALYEASHRRRRQAKDTMKEAVATINDAADVVDTAEHRIDPDLSELIHLQQEELTEELTKLHFKDFFTRSRKEKVASHLGQAVVAEIITA